MIDGVGLELESLNGIFPILSIKQLYFDVLDLIPIGVKATNVDGVHLGSRTRIAEWVDTTSLAEPMFGNFVSGLVERKRILTGQ